MLIYLGYQFGLFVSLALSRVFYQLRTYTNKYSALSYIYALADCVCVGFTYFSITFVLLLIGAKCEVLRNIPKREEQDLAALNRLDTDERILFVKGIIIRAFAFGGFEFVTRLCIFLSESQQLEQDYSLTSSVYHCLGAGLLVVIIMNRFQFLTYEEEIFRMFSQWLFHQELKYALKRHIESELPKEKDVLSLIKDSRVSTPEELSQEIIDFVELSNQFGFSKLCEQLNLIKPEDIRIVPVTQKEFSEIFAMKVYLVVLYLDSLCMIALAIATSIVARCSDQPSELFNNHAEALIQNGLFLAVIISGPLLVSRAVSVKRIFASSSALKSRDYTANLKNSRGIESQSESQPDPVSLAFNLSTSEYRYMQKNGPRMPKTGTFYSDPYNLDSAKVTFLRSEISKGQSELVHQRTYAKTQVQQDLSVLKTSKLNTSVQEHNECL